MRQAALSTTSFQSDANTVCSLQETVVPLVRGGGVNTLLVMPNLVPPLTSASEAMAYKGRLQKLDPSLNYLMTLYLHESITPAVVKDAKAQGIIGIKVYPAGVTTNSKSGVSSYEPFYPVFRAMEQCGMVLNLHGECPSDHEKNITVRVDSESLFYFGFIFNIVLWHRLLLVAKYTPLSTANLCVARS